MTARITVEPTVEPVTLAEAKLHCRIDNEEEDIYVKGLIRTARIYCETFTGRSFVERTVEYTLDRWPSVRAITLPREPIKSILTVKYTSKDGTLYTMTAGVDYLTDTVNGRVILPPDLTWPTSTLYPVNPIAITYIAGYASTTTTPPDYRINIPENFKSAIKLCIGTWYENREGVLPAGHIGKQLPTGVDSLLWMDRTFWLEEMNR